MLKKLSVIFLIFIFLSNFIYSLDLDSVEKKVDSANEKINSFENKVDSTKSFIDKDDDYLWKEWKKIILRNPIVSFFNDFLIKISFVFKSIFGEDYDFSFRFFFMVFIWFYFLFKIYSFLKETPFLERFPFLFSLLFSLFFAHLGLYSLFVDALGKILVLPLIFLKSLGAFFSGFLSKLFGIILIFILLRFLDKVLSIIAKVLKERRNLAEKGQYKRDRTFFQDITHKISEIFTKKN